ncbi:Acyltransferase family protein [Micromonospora phaseoli]|uniref:Acyltransferase family protein n=1 Tax=Micromonospora phaseoli TaxID=1144548 RepID=A0A1H7DFS5_9ACTN|nr:acyltransferase family protein [Micromonospora phaseoli]PZV90790.1 acyltransferase-like protein [Micromonospora phaseoli]GIJ77544.1 membrane protein [Micromonospora phaseoli]SEJ97095.1 Acyltransferase family protein [Micromonospora phaseoli]
MNDQLTAHRDPAIDGLRAYAVVGVVLGHWLVTGLVLDAGGSLTLASPLTAMPALAPVSWVLQTLGLFFFTAGYASGRSAARHPGPGWLSRRLRRLLLPAVALLGTGAAVLLAATVAGVSDDTLSVALTLSLSPLWFLAPLLALVLLTGPLRAAVRRWGTPRCAVTATGVVGAVDLAARLLPAGSEPPPVTVLAAWAVPYLLGLAHAEGRLTGRHDAARLVAIGVAGLATVLVLRYPVSAVGVPGDGRSNLDPPSLLVVALAVTQVGLGLLARPALARLPRHPLPGRLVHEINRHAVRIYLWHQPVLVALAVLVARAGSAQPGLHNSPDGPTWLLARVGWLPVLAVTLAILVHRRRSAPAPSPGPAVEAAGG